MQRRLACVVQGVNCLFKMVQQASTGFEDLRGGLQGIDEEIDGIT